MVLELNLNIGQIIDGVIITEYSNEADGNVFRSQDAFNKKEGICYVNMFGSEFTYADFLEATGGNEEIASWCFEMMICTWNLPESYIEDGLDEGYFVECSCGYVYDHHEVDKCPKCNKFTKDLDKL
jgi:hypothetical protein